MRSIERTYILAIAAIMRMFRQLRRFSSPVARTDYPQIRGEILSLIPVLNASDALAGRLLYIGRWDGWMDGHLAEEWSVQAASGPISGSRRIRQTAVDELQGTRWSDRLTYDHAAHCLSGSNSSQTTRVEEWDGHRLNTKCRVADDNDNGVAGANFDDY